MPKRGRYEFDGDELSADAKGMPEDEGVICGWCESGECQGTSALCRVASDRRRIKAMQGLATKLLALLELQANRAEHERTHLCDPCDLDECDANESMLDGMVQQARRLHDDLNDYGESSSDEEIEEHESDSEEASGPQDGDSESESDVDSGGCSGAECSGVEGGDTE